MGAEVFIHTSLTTTTPIFQQDGAPAHFLLAVKEFLNQKFPDRWFGRGGPVVWAARSPDITHGFFSLGASQDKSV